MGSKETLAMKENICQFTKRGMKELKRSKRQRDSKDVKGVKERWLCLGFENNNF